MINYLVYFPHSPATQKNFRLALVFELDSHLKNAFQLHVKRLYETLSHCGKNQTHKCLQNVMFTATVQPRVQTNCTFCASVVTFVFLNRFYYALYADASTPLVRYKHH